jgi:hypothetical protein
MEWFRAYHGICSDAKWPIVARKAKVSVGVVVSVWLVLLESASQATERGSVANFDPETVDALYGYEDGTTEAVFDALREKGLICDGRISAWDKRQPKRERDDDSAARVRRHRELKRLETTDSANVDERNASVTPCNASVTPPEKRREDKNINTSPPVESLVNQDRACAREASQGRGATASACQEWAATNRQEPESPPMPADLSGPGLEFEELRDFYSREIRAEGPLDGFAEYKQLKAARDSTGASAFPGLSRLLDDLAARKAAGVWHAGYEIGLARYLKTRTWLAPIQARASPQVKSWQEREDEANYAAALQEAARYEAEKARKGGMRQ